MSVIILSLLQIAFNLQGMMADEFSKEFSSAQEEIEYWKSLCRKYKER